MDIDRDREPSPLGEEGDMEQAEEYEDEEEGSVEGEGEEEGPPPKPGRRVKFEQRDRLAVEFQERGMYQRGECREGCHALYCTCRRWKSGSELTHCVLTFL